MTLGEYFKTITDAIRTKSKSSSAIKASAIASAIRSLPNFKDAKSVAGKGSLSGTGTYTENGRPARFGGSCAYTVTKIDAAYPQSLYFYVDCEVDGPEGIEKDTIRACLLVNN